MGLMDNVMQGSGGFEQPNMQMPQQQLPPLPPGMSIEQYKMLIAQERMKQEGIMREKQKQMMLQNLMAQQGK